MKNHEQWSDKSDVKYSLAVIIGRFQPFHNSHLALIKEATQIAESVLILIGSSNVAPNIKNPFSYKERVAMIDDATIASKIQTVGKLIDFEPLSDNLYSDQEWVSQVHTYIDKYKDTGSNARDESIVIVGHEKDDSTYYLNMFPKYSLHKVKNFNQILSSTVIREIYFGNFMIPGGVMPLAVEDFLIDFKKTQKYTDLCEEYKFIEDYKEKFANAPFPPTFVTTDAVVLNNGYILLVKRRMAPGKGLWALPGGFLNQNERIVDGMIRELQEETRIKVNEDILRKSIRASHVFDAPNRSLRGRTITHASLIQLYEKKLPGVRGTDDAERAKWFSVNDFYKMQHMLYEDHFSIASYFINRAE
jgi:bifunctional NMN adenylyltransferase/nudix hydrolase